jgi:DNA helicase-2/ATP-dependent DNA helicase PcrA
MISVKLTAAQRAAVESTANDNIVSAAAGTGKTRVLVARIKWLIDGGAPASSIMALSFTRKAAGELKSRVAEAIGDDAAVRHLTVGTFHSVALRILRQHGHHIGWNGPRIVVLDEADAEMMMLQAARELGYLEGDKWRYGLSLSRAMEFRDWQTTGLRPAWATDEHLRAESRFPLLVGLYRTLLREMNCLDFGTILMDCSLLFSSHPDVLAGYHDQIRHVLVDEAQDLDEVQYNLHRYFSPPASFFGVGDIRQTIYRWRGARPDLMRTQYPDAALWHLNECFRCGPAVVGAANRLIAHNAESETEPMVAIRGIDTVARIGGRSADIAQWLKSLRSNYGLSWGDIAVLGRTHNALLRIDAACQDAGVPSHRVGGRFDICDSPQFRFAIACLRLAQNPKDNLAFIRIAVDLSMAPAFVAELKCAAEHNEFGMLGALRELSDPSREQAPKILVSPFWQRLLSATADPDNDWAMTRSLKDAIALIPPEHRSTQIDAWFESWFDSAPDQSVAEFLSWYAHRGQPSSSQDDVAAGDVVTLSTIHAAKGLEWPCVIVANCNEGELPSSRSTKTPDGVRDERRLAYVAFTRAKEMLVLHSRRPEDQAEERSIRPPSRFLAEAGYE